MQHLAVFKKNVLDLIFRGEKTFESRFSLSKIPPYSTIFEGDEIFLKESGGKVLGKMIAGKIRSFYNLTPEKVKKITKEYNKYVKGSASYWREKEKSHYGTLIEIKNPYKFRLAFEISKHDRRPWITLKGTETPLDKLQLKISFGGSDSLGALKGLIEKYLSTPKNMEEKNHFLEVVKAIGNLASKASIQQNKFNKKEKDEIACLLTDILISILFLSSKFDIDLYESSLKELTKKEKYSLDKLKNF